MSLKSEISIPRLNSKIGLKIIDKRKLSCNLGKWFKNPTISPRKTASPSDVVFANLVEGKSTIPVALKIFLDTSILPKKSQKIKHHLPNVLGIKYEVKVYRDIIDKIVTKKYSPNFVRYLGYGVCPESNVKLINRKVQSSIRKLYGKSFSQAKNLPMGILVTEKAGGKDARKITTLGEWWRKKNFYKDRLAVMFQLVYSIAVMQQYKLVHNDMHSANVILAILKKPVIRYYKIDGRIFNRKTKTPLIFKIKTRYIPYLFDWDFSYSSYLGPNPKIKLDKWCEEDYICNKFDKRVDLYNIFCSLYFKKPIANLYETKVVKKKEYDKFIPTSKYQRKKLRSFSSYMKTDEKIYKMSYNQLVYVFGKKFVDSNFGKSISVLMFHETRHKGKKGIVLFNKHTCSLTTYDKKMLTPLELIKTGYFNKFKVSRIPKWRKEVYRFPL